jgi:hypothetical protein
MMLETILNSFNEDIKQKIVELEERLYETLDFSAVEQAMAEMMNRFSATVLEMMLNQLLSEQNILATLKEMGGRMALKYKEYRTITVRLYNGQRIKVKTPYFSKAKGKGRKRKKKKGNKGAHLGLVVLGFIGRSSSWFVSEVVKMALLCPSFAVAKEVLSGRGIELDVKTVRRLCRELGIIGLSGRGQISLAGGEKIAGHTLVIGIDGGRLRERIEKEGPKKKGEKGPGYSGEWKEPKLFTIYLMNEKGEVVKEFDPLHDATMAGKNGLFAMLEQYLLVLDWPAVSRIVFCGDGAKWIWLGVEALCKKFGFEPGRTYQVIDYTHAKQNLRELIALISDDPKQQSSLYGQWKELLWLGNIEALKQAIGQTARGERKKEALTKWENYFHHNQQRMQYQQFKAKGICCGSGCVESAIRRVINLRLKAAGTFWKCDMAEYFLFLRSQLISGRWSIFMQNVSRRLVKLATSLLSSPSSGSSGGFLSLSRLA